MGLILMAFLLLFVMPIGLGLAFLFQAKKKLGFFMLAIPLLVVLFIVGWWTYEVNHHFVKSTKLGHEKIGDISLYDPVDNEFAEKYGSYRNIDNVFYHVTLEFRKLTIGINNNDKITFISTVDPKMATINNIQVGDSIQTVKETYGKNNYIYRDMGMDDSLHYVDRKEKIHLQFFYRDDIVTQIVLEEM